MKALITALLIAAFAFTSSFAFADKPAGEKANISWMYVLVSEKGKITKSDNGYTLTMDRKDLTNMLMFSDRPARLTKHITATELEKSWKLGSDSFDKDHPNVAVVIDGKTQTVQLATMKVTKDTVEFSLMQDGNVPIQATAEGSTIVLMDPSFCRDRLSGP